MVHEQRQVFEVPPKLVNLLFRTVDDDAAACDQLSFCICFCTGICQQPSCRSQRYSRWRTAGQTICGDPAARDQSSPAACLAGTFLPYAWLAPAPLEIFCHIDFPFLWSDALPMRGVRAQ